MEHLKFTVEKNENDDSMLEFYLADRDKKWLVFVIHEDQFDGHGELGLRKVTFPFDCFFVMDEYDFTCPRCEADLLTN